MLLTKNLPILYDIEHITYEFFSFQQVSLIQVGYTKATLNNSIYDLADMKRTYIQTLLPFVIWPDTGGYA